MLIYLLMARFSSLMKELHRGTFGNGMLAIGPIPLIKEFLTTSDVKKVEYTDNSTSGDSITDLHESWSVLNENGLVLGYYPNVHNT